MIEKKLDTLIATSIDEVIDTLALFFVWNFRGRKEGVGKKGYPFEKLDFFDLFYLVDTHREKEKIPKVLLNFFLRYAESQEENIREIMFDPDVNLYQHATANITFSIEMRVLAKFYYKEDMDEKRLIEISEDFEDYESYLDVHFWGNVGCDMQNCIASFAN